MDSNKPFGEPLKSSDYYIRLFDQLPSLMWRSGVNTQCNWFNTKWLEFTGRTLKQELTNGWTEGVHPDDFDRCLKVYLDNFHARQPFEMDYRLKHHSGTYRWIRDIGQPFNDEHGVFAGYIGTCYDIHEGKEAEINQSRINLEIRAKNESLQRINYDLDSFVYTASHDLKAPVSNIEGLIYTLKDLINRNNSTQDELNLIMRLIEDSIARFKNTIIDLTEITKVQREAEEDIIEINCDKLIQDIKLSIYKQIMDSNAAIEVDISACNCIKFSRKHLQSIIYNLLTNAIKYREKDRTLQISIKTELTNEFSIIIVQDNGLGISEKNLKKLFSMFKRFHDHVEGSGIGLYIVKRIIDNAGGKIEVVSNEGIGSTFKVYLPLNLRLLPLREVNNLPSLSSERQETTNPINYQS